MYSTIYIIIILFFLSHIHFYFHYLFFQSICSVCWSVIFRRVCFEWSTLIAYFAHLYATANQYADCWYIFKPLANCIFTCLMKRWGEHFALVSVNRLLDYIFASCVCVCVCGLYRKHLWLVYSQSLKGYQTFICQVVQMNACDAPCLQDV